MRPPGRLAAVVASIAAHLFMVAALVWSRTEPPKMVDPGPMTVALIDGPLMVSAPTPPAAAPPTPTKPVPQKSIARPTTRPPDRQPLAAKEEEQEEQEPIADPGPQLSDAQLAMASTADSGATGRACDMARWVQGALRKNAKVQAAVAQVHRALPPGRKAIFLWNGDWIRHSGQDGAGLAGVREAMMLEIAFAPETCRVAEPMHGLLLISMNDGPGAPRLAVGSGEWRWSDLLNPRSVRLARQ